MTSANLEMLANRLQSALLVHLDKISPSCADQVALRYVHVLSGQRQPLLKSLCMHSLVCSSCNVNSLYATAVCSTSSGDLISIVIGLNSANRNLNEHTIQWASTFASKLVCARS